ncbi:hypothetical protein ACFT7S_22045 [Streptomyces sp. NPDC057136]|uniref:hypothetical protein n=1 Tax=Streptomyces sp. NPDC057136 TaxID=3346029 RepID=UPI00363FD005
MRSQHFRTADTCAHLVPRRGGIRSRDHRTARSPPTRLPDHGAHTQQAKYEIDTGSGAFTKTRYVNQKRFANNWVSLGVYKMAGVPRVRLTTQTANPVSAFVGHGGCDDPEWINKVVIGPNGDGDFHKDDEASPFCTWSWLGGDCLSRESFHPKSDGTTGHAGVMQNRLGQIGYQWS